MCVWGPFWTVVMGLVKTWTAVMAEGGESPEVTRLWDPL